MKLKKVNAELQYPLCCGYLNPGQQTKDYPFSKRFFNETFPENVLIRNGVSSYIYVEKEKLYPLCNEHNTVRLPCNNTMQ